MTAQAAITLMILILNRKSAIKAATPIKVAIRSKSLPFGHKTFLAKNIARLIITPTTAAVTAESGALNLRSPLVASTPGPPKKINKNDGKKVNNVATDAPAKPANNKASGPNISFVQAPTKPTNATTIISGPGVVSPNAKPSIICVLVSQAY